MTATKIFGICIVTLLLHTLICNLHLFFSEQWVKLFLWELSRYVKALNVAFLLYFLANQLGKRIQYGRGIELIFLVWGFYCIIDLVQFLWNGNHHNPILDIASFILICTFIFIKFKQLQRSENNIVQALLKVFRFRKK